MEAYEIEKADKVADIELKRANAQKSLAEIQATMAKASKDIVEAEAQDIENAAFESGIAEMLEAKQG